MSAFRWAASLYPAFTAVASSSIARSTYSAFLSAIVLLATAYTHAKAYHCPAAQFDDFVSVSTSGGFAFADWLTEQRPRVLPKSTIGEAVTDAPNEWPTHGVYLADGRLTIDNAEGERAIRSLCDGASQLVASRRDGGLRATAMLLSTVASHKRHRLDPWDYLTHVLSELPACPPGRI